MSNPFKNFDWSLKSVAKAGGVVLAGVVGLTLVAMLVSFAIQTVASPFRSDGYSDMMAFDEAVDFDYLYDAKGGATMQASRAFTNNILPIPGPSGGFVDVDAEDYEVQTYTASFRVGNKEKICQEVFILKADKDIVFENANDYERGCNYSFKVVKERTDEILVILEELDPDELSSNTYTIQKAVVGLTDRLDVLGKKLEQIEKTLGEAQGSYDELTKLATRRNDIESLTKLIELKLNTIDRLSRERLSVNEQIASVERDRAEQLERLQYTNFNVSVYEDRIIDWDQLGENWKQELRTLVDDVNKLAQWVSIKLVSFVLQAMVAVLYLSFALVLLKLLWVLGKKLWKVKIIRE